VMNKSIEFAIYWLPLIASVVLGTIATGAWYGGDKLPAIWLGFVGNVFLLLTFTLQLQQYVSANILQPQLEMQNPVQRSVIEFKADGFTLMTFRGENEALPPGNWKLPVFPIVNRSSINAQDVNVKWSARPHDEAAVLAASDRLKPLKPQFASRRLNLGNTIYNLQPSTTVPMPFITRTSETFPPLDVWNEAAMFFVATLPDTPGSKSDPFSFDVSITWNIPDGAKPAKFRVKAVATNAKLPSTPADTLVATVDFSVEPEQP
jgi:hypothetical protein